MKRWGWASSMWRAGRWCGVAITRRSRLSLRDWLRASDRSDAQTVQGRLASTLGYSNVGAIGSWVLLPGFQHEEEHVVRTQGYGLGKTSGGHLDFRLAGRRAGTRSVQIAHLIAG